MVSPEQPSELLTVEQFAERHDDLPDGGRWTELIGGKAVPLSPPEPAHGTVVLNLAKALATHVQTSARGGEQCGYACFELGLIVRRNPDTVRCPAVSYFSGGTPFSESDKVVTEARPAVVVEIASSNDRRRDMAERVTGYLDMGVELVWVIDTHGTQVHVFERHRQPRVVAAHETLFGGSALSRFQINVGDLFQEPKWRR